MRKETAYSNLQQIIDEGYCIGCGTCAVIEGTIITMEFDEYLQYQAKMPVWAVNSEKAFEKALFVCPFSNTGSNENEISKKVLSGDNEDPQIGRYIDAFAGYVLENDYRNRGTSGGSVSWILNELYTREFIDAVIHVKKATNRQKGKLFQYAISKTKAEINEGAKSRYYPVEMSDVLDWVKKNPGNYALVGLPCFIKASRLLAIKDADFYRCISFRVGLFCGHLKSGRFVDFYGWQLGINPGEVGDIDFRVKLPGLMANDYGVSVESENNEAKPIVRRNNEFFGANWEYGFFKYEACDYCDDVVSETADVSIGDAWLPEYMSDSNGTNIIVVRNAIIQRIIEKGIETQKLAFSRVNAGAVVSSQAGGFRHRREGLAYRLYLKDKQRQWRPVKRVDASCAGLTFERKKIYNLRMKLRHTSHIVFLEAIKKGNLKIFSKMLTPIIAEYRDYYRKGSDSWRCRLKRVIKKCIGYHLIALIKRR